MAKRGKKKPAKKKALKKLSAKSKGKVWGGMRMAWRSFKASVATLKNRKASKKAKAKAHKRLDGSKKAIHKFQGLLGLRQTKFRGVAA